MFSIFKRPKPSDISRDFAEASIKYWLSRYGFKCARVERNGIDFLAKNLKTNRMLGISVRSVIQPELPSDQSIAISLGDISKARLTCSTFSCVPYFAFQVYQEKQTCLFLISLEHLLAMQTKSEANVTLSLTEIAIDQYVDDPEILFIESNHKLWRWFSDLEN
jgi:hypothetical protein